MRIDISLNEKSIRNAIKRINKYKYDLTRKMERFVSELAEIGIEVATDNTFIEVDGEVRNFGDSLIFEKQIENSGDVVSCLLIVDAQTFTKTWIGGAAEVNPLYMAEFGSGEFAVEGHKGTFPSPTAKQHTDNPPWYWRDDGGRLHKSSGSEPSRPLLKAKEEMRSQILSVALGIFKT